MARKEARRKESEDVSDSGTREDDADTVSNNDGRSNRNARAKKRRGGWLCCCCPSLQTSLIILACSVAFQLAWNNAEMQKKIRDLNIMEQFDGLGISLLPNSTSKFYSMSEATHDEVGGMMAKRGAKAKYPVIIIPGFVTSGLELWAGHECSAGLFRKRMWTHMKMAQTLFQNSSCWVTHLSLNFSTGLDPEGIRLRSAHGLDAVDYFFTGYSVWAKPIEALAAIGYDAQSMVAMPFDWRLSIPNMELRDAYFTRLRGQVESLAELYHEKILLAAHSWGDNVARAFMHWMEDVQPGWVENHIAALVNVAGPTLGIPKSGTAVLSGEMRDTAQLHGLMQMVGDQFLNKEDRTLLWRTWGSSIGMLPHGGTKVWGTKTFAPDDNDMMRKLGRSYGAMLTVKREARDKTNSTREWFTARPGLYDARNGTHPFDVDDTLAEILRDAGPYFLHHVQEWAAGLLPDDLSTIKRSFCPRYCDANGNIEPAHIHSLLTGDTDADVAQGELDAARNSTAGRPLYPKHKGRTTMRARDPTQTPLPNAPSLRIYCFYGYGLNTERSYHYLHYDQLNGTAEHEAKEHGQEEYVVKNQALAQEQKSAGAAWEINRQANVPDEGIEQGVQYSDGDGTVPLLSLGAMCEGGWRTKKLNPHGVKIVTREYKNNVASIIQGGGLRGGPENSAHVEVLANKFFLEDLLKVAAGWHDQVPDHIGSEIHTIVGNIEGWARHK